MVSTEAVQITADLAPEDGWWNSDAENAVETVVHEMLEAGMNAGHVEELIGETIAAIRGEYGE